MALQLSQISSRISHLFMVQRQGSNSSFLGDCSDFPAQQSLWCSHTPRLFLIRCHSLALHCNHLHVSWRGVPVRFGSQSPPSEGTEALQTAGPAVWSMPGQLPQGHNEDRTQSQRAHTPAPILPCWAKTRGREGARNGQPLAHGSSRAF